MEKTQKIDLKQRERLVAMLEEAKHREKKQLEEQSTVSESSIVSEIIESKGYLPLLKQVRGWNEQMAELQKKIEDVDSQFSESGFERHGSGLTMRWNAPLAVRRLVAKKLEEARQPIEKSIKKYDLAIARMWTSLSGEELQKVVEGVI